MYLIFLKTLLGYRRELQFESKSASERAADRRGSRVLIRSRNLSTHCQTAVGFLF
jgi:hypothetical protein